MEYAEIGHNLQIERGHVKPNQAFLQQQGVETPDTITQAESVDVFNQIATKNGLNELKDPKGYQKLDNNVYDMLHDTYQDVYARKAYQAESQVIQGGPYAFRAMLEKSKMNGTIQKEIRTHLPKDMNYTDLKYIKSNPMLKKQSEQMFEKRAEITNLHNIRRSVEPQRKQGVIDDFNHVRDNLVNNIADIWSGKAAKPSLSIKQLQANSNNNVAGLKTFIQNIKEPNVAPPDEYHDRAFAEYQTKDMDSAKFLMANKAYLKDFGFEITNRHGSVTAHWESDKIDKIAKQQLADSKKQNEEAEKLDLAGATEDLNNSQSNGQSL